MSIRRLQFAALAVVCGSLGPVLAQPVNLGGPFLGLTFDPNSGQIRPIWGAPGSATQGAPIETPGPLARVAVAPQGDSALGVVADSGALVHLNLPGGNAVVEAIGGERGEAQLVAYSPSGARAVLFSERPRALEVLRIENGRALPERSIDLWRTWGQVVSIAVSDDGSAVLAGVTGPAGATVRLWRAGSPYPERLGDFVDASALALAGGSSGSWDAIVGDRQTRRITLIRDVLGAQQVLPLAGPDQGVREPMALRASSDGRLILEADAKGRYVRIVDRESGASAVIHCDCLPSRLEPLRGSRQFRITDSSTGPIWILDLQGSEPKLLFVPPPAGGDQ